MSVYFSFEDVMKYASSTLLFAEYVDQKDKSDSTNQNDLIKTTLEFLITNEFIALVHVKKEEIADVLTKGTYYTHITLICVYACGSSLCDTCYR